MKKPSKLLQALAAAGVAAGVSIGSVEHAAAKTDNAFASRFKEPGDTGRPDIFGPPGKPVIGPPGQYEG